MYGESFQQKYQTFIFRVLQVCQISSSYVIPLNVSDNSAQIVKLHKEL